MFQTHLIIVIIGFATLLLLLLASSSSSAQDIHSHRWHIDQRIPLSVPPIVDGVDPEQWQLVRDGLQVDGPNSRAFVVMRKWKTPGLAVVDLREDSVAATAAVGKRTEFLVLQDHEHLLPEYVGGCYYDSVNSLVWLAIANKNHIVSVDVSPGGGLKHSTLDIGGNADDFIIDIGGAGGYDDDSIYVGLAGWFKKSASVVKIDSKTRRRVGSCDVPIPGAAPGAFVFPFMYDRYFFAVTLHRQHGPVILTFDSTRFTDQEEQSEGGECLVQSLVLSNIYDSDVPRKVMPAQPGMVHRLVLGDKHIFALLRTTPGTIIRVNLAPDAQDEGMPVLSLNENDVVRRAKYTFPHVALSGRISDFCAGFFLAEERQLTLASCSSFKAAFPLPHHPRFEVRPTVVQLDQDELFAKNRTKNVYDLIEKLVVTDEEVTKDFSWTAMRRYPGSESRGEDQFVVVSGSRQPAEVVLVKRLQKSPGFFERKNTDF